MTSVMASVMAPESVKRGHTDSVGLHQAFAACTPTCLLEDVEVTSSANRINRKRGNSHQGNISPDRLSKRNNIERDFDIESEYQKKNNLSPPNTLLMAKKRKLNANNEDNKGSLKKAGKVADDQMINERVKTHFGFPNVSNKDNNKIDGIFLCTNQLVTQDLNSNYSHVDALDQSMAERQNQLGVSQACKQEKISPSEALGDINHARTMTSDGGGEINHARTMSSDGGLDITKASDKPVALAIANSCAICGRSSHGSVGGICQTCFTKLQSSGVLATNREEPDNIPEVIKPAEVNLWNDSKDDQLASISMDTKSVEVTPQDGQTANIDQRSAEVNPQYGETVSNMDHESTVVDNWTKPCFGDKGLISEKNDNLGSELPVVSAQTTNDIAKLGAQVSPTQGDDVNDNLLDAQVLASRGTKRGASSDRKEDFEVSKMTNPPSLPKSKTCANLGRSRKNANNVVLEAKKSQALVVEAERPKFRRTESSMKSMAVSHNKKVLRAKSEWNMKKNVSKGDDFGDMINKHMRNAAGKKDGQVDLMSNHQVTKLSTGKFHISDASKNNVTTAKRENTMMSKRGVSQIAISSQKQKKENSIRRDKEITFDTKERYEPTTVRESKDIALTKERLIEKNKTPLSARPILSALSRSKSSRKNIVNLDGSARGKSLWTAGRKQDDTNTPRRYQPQGFGSKTSKFFYRPNSKPSGCSSASEDENDEDEVVEKNCKQHTLLPSGKLTVNTGQDESRLNIAEVTRRVWLKNKVKSKSASISEESSFKTPSSLNSIEEEDSSLLSKTLNSEPNRESSIYFEQPSYKAIRESALTCVASNTLSGFRETSPFSKQEKDVSYYCAGVNKSVVEEAKKIMRTAVEKEVTPSDTSIYTEHKPLVYTEHKPLSRFLETSITSNDYTLGFGAQNKQKTQMECTDLSAGLTATQDLPFGVGEALEPVRNSSTYHDGAIFGLAKTFSSIDNFQPLGVPENNYKVLSNGSLTKGELPDNSLISESCYTGGFFNNPEVHPDKKVGSLRLGDEMVSCESSLSLSHHDSALPQPSDSETYTGAVFQLSKHIPQSMLNESKDGSTSLVTTDGPKTIENAVQHMTKEIQGVTPITSDTLTNDVVTSNTEKALTCRRRKNKQNMDSIIERGLDSAGEFFSKSLVRFNIPAMPVSFNFNNHSNSWFSGPRGPFAICGSTCTNPSFSQDDLHFEDQLIETEEYTNFKPGLGPGFFNPTNDTEPFSLLPRFDYSKYQGDDGEDEVDDAVCAERWYYNSRKVSHTDLPTNAKQDELSSEINTKKVKKAKYKNTGNTTDYYDCKMCPCFNFNNSAHPSLGDTNNNYPNYGCYDTVSKENPKTKSPPPKANDSDYSPCLFASCGATTPLHLTTQSKPEPEKLKTMKPVSYYFDLPVSSYEGSSVDYADAAEEVQGKIIKPPAPPAKPKITQVGSILVRNNVENDCDYAENVNRDMADDGFGAMGFAENAPLPPFPENIQNLKTNVDHIPFMNDVQHLVTASPATKHKTPVQPDKPAQLERFNGQFDRFQTMPENVPLRPWKSVKSAKSSDNVKGNRSASRRRSQSKNKVTRDKTPAKQTKNPKAPAKTSTKNSVKAPAKPSEKPTPRIVNKPTASFKPPKTTPREYVRQQEPNLLKMNHSKPESQTQVVGGDGEANKKSMLRKGLGYIPLVGRLF